MASFLSSLGSNTGLSIQDMEVGMGKKGMSFSVNLDIDMTTLTSWFTSIGISSVHLSNDVTVSLTYEHSRGNSAESGFETRVKINIPGPISPGDLLTDFDLPSDIIPTIDKAELSLELEKMTDTVGSDESLEVEIKLTFSPTKADANQASDQFVFVGALNKTTTTINKVSTAAKIFGGNIFSPSGGSLDLGSSLPVSLDIKNIFLAQVTLGKTGTAQEKFAVFGTDLSVNVDINLSKLPVIGSFLTEAQFSFKGLRITYASAAITGPQLQFINSFLTTIDAAPLSVKQSSLANSGNSPANFPAGFSIQGNLILGPHGDVIPLHSVFASPPQPTKKKTQPPLNTQTSSASSTASPVAKKYGPVKIESAGLGLSNGDIEIKFTGGLILGPLELDFIGFDITSPVHSFDPSISLKGMGIGINKPPLTLSGLFMEAQINVPEKDPTTGQVNLIPVDAYNGSLNIGYKKYSLAAEASYAQLPDGVSTVFLYGFLGAPLGGPPVCFVTGVAAGFGYNRTLTLPVPKTINTYPLIQPVLPGNTAPTNFSAMDVDFFPQDGAFWGAVGIRAESFKMINSFALLVVRVTEEVEIDVIGISKMIFPLPKDGSSEPPLAKIGIGIVARFLPERGVLAINGAFLAKSYVLNPLATITGGFAVLTIFKDQNHGTWKNAHEGDFVVTIGGYATNYTPKPYYPKVNRIQLQWKVSSNISLKVSAYFAITPQALMAGGNMQANFSGGGGPVSFAVFFKMGADFIIYWKPYHYSATFYMSMTASVSIHLLFIHVGFNIGLSANLNVWGPSFTGNGVVSVHLLVSFSIHVSFGDATPSPQPIQLSEFSASFLPASDKIISTHIATGINGAVSTDTLKVVNPKELEVTVGTVFPVKNVTLAGSTSRTLCWPVGQALSLGAPANGKSWTCTLVSTTNTLTVISNSVAATSACKVIVTDTVSTWEVNFGTYDQFGIKPMAITVDDLDSGLTLTVTRGGAVMDATEVNKNFDISVVTKNMPAALWEPAEAGKSGTLPPNETNLIHGLLSGVSINAKKNTFTPTTSNSYTMTTDGPKVDKLYGEASTFVETFTYGATNNNA